MEGLGLGLGLGFGLGLRFGLGLGLGLGPGLGLGSGLGLEHVGSHGLVAIGDERGKQRHVAVLLHLVGVITR